MIIPPEDLLIEVIDPFPKGGQQVGVRMTEIKVTHLPTGLVAICNSRRSQHRSREIAEDMILGGLTSKHF